MAAAQCSRIPSSISACRRWQIPTCRPSKIRDGEIFYPLHAYVCDRCFLVQLEEFESPEAIFSDYAYFSGFSTSWLRHAETYAAQCNERFRLGPGHKVVEIASNDGYLLQYFVARDIPVLGVEPARNVAAAAIAKGVPTEVMFFGEADGASVAAARAMRPISWPPTMCSRMCPTFSISSAAFAFCSSPEGWRHSSSRICSG